MTLNISCHLHYLGKYKIFIDFHLFINAVSSNILLRYFLYIRGLDYHYMKKALLLSATIFVLASLRLAAQTEVSLYLHDSSVQTFSVNETGKIYFDNERLFIDDGTAVPYSFEVSSIRKMRFDAPVGIEDITTPEFKIYPNPVGSFLKISGTSYPVHYEIFAMDGRLMMVGNSNSETTLDMSSFAKGLYLIKINGKTFKISKI